MNKVHGFKGVRRGIWHWPAACRTHDRNLQKLRLANGTCVGPSPNRDHASPCHWERWEVARQITTSNGSQRVTTIFSAGEMVWMTSVTFKAGRRRKEQLTQSARSTLERPRTGKYPKFLRPPNGDSSLRDYRRWSVIMAGYYLDLM